MYMKIVHTWLYSDFCTGTVMTSLPAWLANYPEGYRMQGIYYIFTNQMRTPNLLLVGGGGTLRLHKYII